MLSAVALGSIAPVPLGVRATRSDSEWRVGGAAASGIADLAEQFPAQVIDPEVHKLLEEGPGRRRRFLDWGVFHVEHGFLSNWRRYHQALRQRNAALKKDASDADLVVWERELAASGESLAAQRQSYLERIAAPLAQIGDCTSCAADFTRSPARLGFREIAAGRISRRPGSRPTISRYATGPASQRHHRAR